MLNELESLSQNIGRLITDQRAPHQARHALEEQLEQLRADYAERAGRTCASARRARYAASGTRRALRENRRRAGAPERDSRKTAARESRAAASRTTNSICSSAAFTRQHVEAREHGEHQPRRKSMTTKQIEVSILGAAVSSRVLAGNGRRAARSGRARRCRDVEDAQCKQRARHGSHRGDGGAFAGVGIA